jgi:hypothetical protein
VAENTVYINGLNVTDFYNRVGFSSAPFAFFKEFQVKTGGYSVEFGRSTGGVINAVTRSGSNDFKAGAELVFEPRAWQSQARDRYDGNGSRYITASRDDYSRSALNVFASGALVQDRLFFFGMYEARDYRPTSTNDAGTGFNQGKADDPFWGGKIDWRITDNQMLSLFGFSDRTRRSPTSMPTTTTLAAAWASVQPDHEHRWPQLVGHLQLAGQQRSDHEVDVRREQAQPRAELVDGPELQPRVRQPHGRPGRAAVAAGRPQLHQQLAAGVGAGHAQGRARGLQNGRWATTTRFGLDREENTSDYSRAYPARAASATTSTTALPAAR